MDRDTPVKCESEISAGERCERVFWLMACANALAHELVYANKGTIGRYDAWEVAGMIEAATDAAMQDCGVLSEALCDEAIAKEQHGKVQKECPRALTFPTEKTLTNQ